MGHISSSGATVKTNLRINNTGHGKVTLNGQLSKYSSERYDVTISCIMSYFNHAETFQF